MDNLTKNHFNTLESSDKKAQYDAYIAIMEATKDEVDWSYVVWDALIEDLTDSDHHKKSRAAQFLSNLAISDPEKRIFNDFPLIWEVTKDKKFVTARHSLQNIWRVGLAGQKQKELVITHLVDRFKTCISEKNATLIRYDILQGLRNLYDNLKDEEIKEKALRLIELEDNSKYQKKYASLWKNIV